MVANVTARYDWFAWHLVPDDRAGPNEAKASGFFALTAQVIPHDSFDALYVDFEYWKALSDEKVLGEDVDISRTTLSVGWRFLH